MEFDRDEKNNKANEQALVHYPGRPPVVKARAVHELLRPLAHAGRDQLTTCTVTKRRIEGRTSRSATGA